MLDIIFILLILISSSYLAYTFVNDKIILERLSEIVKDQFEQIRLINKELYNLKRDYDKVKMDVDNVDLKIILAKEELNYNIKKAKEDYEFIQKK